MNPKIKAKELVEKYAYHLWIDGICDYEQAKQFALIATEEIIKECHLVNKIYWEEVKIEINKL
jgi:hypothetical protein